MTLGSGMNIKLLYVVCLYSIVYHNISIKHTACAIHCRLSCVYYLMETMDEEDDDGISGEVDNTQGGISPGKLVARDVVSNFTPTKQGEKPVIDTIDILNDR